MLTSKKVSESIRLGSILMFSGGFLDAYSYLVRGQVFATAETGNIALMGISLARGDLAVAGRYLIPVAAYAAAGLADSSTSKTGWLAFMLGLPGFIIPFVYVYNPALLIVDTPVLDTVWIVILATFAVVLMSMAVIGWFKGKLNPVFRFAMAVAAVLMFVPGIIFDVIGLGLGIVIISFLVVTRRKAPSAV